jgi:hypothetical protein
MHLDGTGELWCDHTLVKQFPAAKFGQVVWLPQCSSWLDLGPGLIIYQGGHADKNSAQMDKVIWNFFCNLAIWAEMKMMMLGKNG